jgi:DNA-binding NtrC family response regulator
MAPAPAEACVTRPVVLCVDDNAEVLTSIVRSLRSLEIDVLATCESREALRWLGTREIAVLISDIEMPAMTGIELASAARHVSPQTMRILISGQRVFENVIDGINQGEVFKYISKPFDPKGFREVVKAAVERHHELAAQVGDLELTNERVRVAREVAASLDLTHVERANDGTYVVSEAPRTVLAALGLERLHAFRRQS